MFKNPQVFYALISLLYDRIGEWGDGNPAIDPLEGIYVPNEIESKEETVLVAMDIVKIETDPLTIVNESLGSAFTISNSFSVPAKAVGKEKVHQCDICSKIFPNARQLNRHETVFHYGGHKARECNVCGKTFHSPYWLVEHMKLHSKEKPYKCNVCGKAYAQERVFKAHEKLHATEVKEIKCQFCELQLKNLMHKKLHSEKRPYKCNVCLEGFDCSGLLGKHSKTHIS